MSAQLLSHLADTSIRSLVLALVAAILLSIVRSRRTAALEHAVWTMVVCGMLAFFAFGGVLPRLPLRVWESPAAPAAVTLPERMAPILPEQVYAAPGAPVPANNSRPISWRDLAVYAYAAIALALLTRFLMGMLLVRKMLAGATPILHAGMSELYESDQIRIPFTVGWLHAKILLPLEWSEWSRDKLDAVLAHENAHRRRRDALIAAIARINVCVFWFHPLAWMLERRLALLAEKACDEFCVAELGDREGYARLLLDFARVVDAAHGRLRSHALTMAAASHIRQRIDGLLENRRTFSKGLSRATQAAVVLCGISVVAGAGAVELERQAPLARIDAPRWHVGPPALSQEKPVLLAQAQTVAAQPAVPAAKPKFDSATVKPCSSTDGIGRSGRGGGAGGRGFGSSPGWFWVTCLSVSEMMDVAYIQNGERLINESGFPGAASLRGGPDWFYSDRYSVDAETNNPIANGPAESEAGPDTPARRVMNGPMLQSLLEDRFHLKSHRETEEVPMYDLTVAPGGFKLQPMEEGGCTPPVKLATGGTIMPKREGNKPYCHWTGWGAHGPNRYLESGEIPLSRFAEDLSEVFMDHYVLDKTGITGNFNLYVEFAPDEHTPLHEPFNHDPHLQIDPTSDIPRAPSMFDALKQQLGLQLVDDKGPHGYIVIDHVERPGN